MTIQEMASKFKTVGGNIATRDLSNVVSGGSSEDFVADFAEITDFVAEAEPILGVIQLISGRCLQLLHIIGYMLAQDDTFDDVCLEQQLTLGIRYICRDQTAMLVIKTEGCTR